MAKVILKLFPAYAVDSCIINLKKISVWNLSNISILNLPRVRCIITLTDPGTKRLFISFW